MEMDANTLWSCFFRLSRECNQHFNRLAAIWRDLGLCEEQRKSRRDDFEKRLIKKHIELLSAFVEGEEKMKQKLVTDVASYRNELDNLCNEMQRSCELPNEDLPLVTKANHLKSKVDSLQKEKHERMKQLERLAEMEFPLCKILGEETVILPIYKRQEVPSEDALKEFLYIIQKMKAKQAANKANFFAIRNKIMMLWTMLEAEPSNQKQQYIFEGDVNKYCLSQENMDYLTEVHLELEKEASQLEFKAAALRERVVSLWTKLAIPVEEREEFNQMYPGISTKIIKAWNKELERVKELKKQNLKQIIEKTRTELGKLWDKCRYGEQQKREFTPAFRDDYSDDALSAHESELDKMKILYEGCKDIFKLIDKWEDVWSKMLHFEANGSDPSRLENRGGKLLKEEKARKAIEKELPKIEKELESNLSQWERDWERHFVLHDRRYLDIITERRQDRQNKKDDEKQKRIKTKGKTNVTEMMFRSKPVLGKRKHAGVTSPSSVALPKNNPVCKKIKKVASSPPVCSTLQTQSNTIKRRPSKRKNNDTQRYVPRRILSSKNSSIPEKSYISQGFDLSIASTGNYSDFQKGLQQGLTTSQTACSSIVQKNDLTASSTLEYLSALSK